MSSWAKSVEVVRGVQASRVALEYEEKKTYGRSREQTEKSARIMSRYFSPLFDGYWVIRTLEDEQSFRLDSDAIARGVQVVIGKYPHHAGALLGDDARQDALTGDVLIQCAIFGEIRYG